MVSLLWVFFFFFFFFFVLFCKGGIVVCWGVLRGFCAYFFSKFLECLSV